MTLTLAPKSLLQIEEATTLDGLEDLRPEWEDLWQACSQGTPFQSPAWLISWWKHLGQGELWVLAVREQERLIGLAPFVISDENGQAARQLLLAGTGVSDYVDVLAQDDQQSLIVEAIWEHLAENADRWDRCDFQQVRPCSPLLKHLPQDRRVDVEPQEICPILKLPERARELTQVIPTDTLASLNYYRRRLDRSRKWHVEQATRENFEELFENLLRLHQSRWEARGQSGVLAEKDLRTFHREAAEGLLKSKVLRLYGLRLNGAIIASFYGFAHGGRVYCYLGGFDPEFRALSPGWLMIGHAIEQAMAEGATEFDFLRGQEAYKFRWGAKESMTYRVVFGHSNWTCGEDYKTWQTRRSAQMQENG